VVFFAKFEIALVVRGNGHDGTGSVSSSTKFPTQMGVFLPERIYGITSGEEALFFGSGKSSVFTDINFYSRQFLFAWSRTDEPSSSSAAADAWEQESARLRRRLVSMRW